MGRIIHFEILGDDPARLAEFYRQTLGWEFQSWDGGHPYVLLATGPKDEDGIDGAIMPRFFPQAVINTALARIEAAGGKKVWGPNEIPNIGTHAYCEDPEGNMFGVIQAADPQASLNS